MAGDNAVRSLLEKMAQCASNAYLSILERYILQVSCQYIFIFIFLCTLQLLAIVFRNMYFYINSGLWIFFEPTNLMYFCFGFYYKISHLSNTGFIFLIYSFLFFLLFGHSWLSFEHSQLLSFASLVTVHTDWFYCLYGKNNFSDGSMKG